MRSDRGKILIFGGTTEGRTAAERLLAEGVPCTVCVATRYGGEVLQPHPLMTVHAGRLGRADMAQMMREGLFSCVIDATHPYAQIVSQEIRAACEETGLVCLRLQRGKAGMQRAHSETAEGIPGDESCIYVRDVDEAGTFLASVSGRILVTTGSKELVRFTKALGDFSRITARVLPAPESLRACAEAGLAGKQIFAMQGPFDTEMNCALIRHAGVSWLLTRESGAVGGYPEKIEAARQCGIRAVVIRAPSADNNDESGGQTGSRAYSAQGESAEGRTVQDESMVKSAVESVKSVFRNPDLEQTVAAALQYASGRKPGQKPGGTEQIQQRILSLIGVGVGAQEAGTQQAQEAIAEAEVLFGAKSVLENLTGTWRSAAGKEIVPIYESTAILEYLAEHPQIRNAAVACSGDTGVYSGASSMLLELKKTGDFKQSPDVRVICGISSVSWFAARAGIPWQDWKILSSHGRFCNVTGHVRRNRECFLLSAGADDLRQTGEALVKAQERGVLGKLHLICGYELSRPAEEIRVCTAQELTRITQEGLYVLYIRHDDSARISALPGLPDSAFIRGKAPMTSSEIRALSLCCLKLTPEAVIWDIGAGTGSVSVEAALACPAGQVWSVEYEREALDLLAENRAKYCLQNMSIIEGRAPEALEKLPVPTHVFIGGSGGEIGGILELVLSRNPEAGVVVNCITSETLAALRTALERLPIRDFQCVQVMVNREERLGRCHYLRAGNPVFIHSFTGDGLRQPGR